VSQAPSAPEPSPVEVIQGVIFGQPSETVMIKSGRYFKKNGLDQTSPLQAFRCTIFNAVWVRSVQRKRLGEVRDPTQLELASISTHRN
jgi:hypothetical protein